MEQIYFIAMSPLEQLGPIVSFYQACGAIPYTMEYDSGTKKIIRFNFSFKNFTTWWFIVLIILQVFVLCTILNVQIKMLIDLTRDSPVTVSIVMFSISICFFSQILVFRWMMLFRYHRIRSALKAAQAAEELLFLKNGSVAPKSSFLKRFVIGFVLIVMTVSYC